MRESADKKKWNCAKVLKRNPFVLAPFFLSLSIVGFRRRKGSKNGALRRRGRREGRAEGRNSEHPVWGQEKGLTPINSDFFRFVPISFCHPAAKGVRQKESGKKVTKKVTEASEKVTKKWPKESQKRKKVIELLLPRSFCGTLILICSDLRCLFSGGGHPDLFRFASDFFRFALLVEKVLTPVCSGFFRFVSELLWFVPFCIACFREYPDLFQFLRFALISSDLPSEQTRETPFC